MSRPILLSNGYLHVGINLFGMVHDLYYPHVGLENHCAAQRMRHRIGVWVENQFSWLDDGSWTFTMDYDSYALIGHITAHNDHLAVTLDFTDCVDSEYNAFLRNIHVMNAADRPREIRLFLHQVMLISNSLNPDTVQYLPSEAAIIQYKGDRAFAIGAQDGNGEPFQQFTVGLFGTDGYEGSYRDAEDGKLDGNVVEHTKVDSALGFNLQLAPFESTRVQYWLAAAKNVPDAVSLHHSLKNSDLHARFEHTAAYWHRWLLPAESHIAEAPKHLQASMRKSLLIIKSHIDHKGGVIASTDTTMLKNWRDTYAYCWPRDAAFALWPLLRLGYKKEVKQFFEFCRDALHPDGFLEHKYQADGTLGASWLPYIVQGRQVPPIQEDETACVVLLLGDYIRRTSDKRTLDDMYYSFVVPAADFMANYINPRTRLPHASYDLWEEKFLTTTYTTSIVYAALCAAADMAKRRQEHQDQVRWQTVADDMRESAQKLLFNPQKQYFYKGFVTRADGEMKCDDTMDISSLYGANLFGLFDRDSAEVIASHQSLLARYSLADAATTRIGRYEWDKYFTINQSGLGNPWFVTSLWLAQYDLHHNNRGRAERTLDWVTDSMLPTGVLSEQINPFNNGFISVAPLIWSQAEYIHTVLNLIKANKK